MFLQNLCRNGHTKQGSLGKLLTQYENGSNLFVLLARKREDWKCVHCQSHIVPLKVRKARQSTGGLSPSARRTLPVFFFFHDLSSGGNVPGGNTKGVSKSKNKAGDSALTGLKSPALTSTRKPSWC